MYKIVLGERLELNSKTEPREYDSSSKNKLVTFDSHHDRKLVKNIQFLAMTGGKKVAFFFFSFRVKLPIG